MISNFQNRTRPTLNRTIDCLVSIPITPPCYSPFTHLTRKVSRNFWKNYQNEQYCVIQPGKVSKRFSKQIKRKRKIHVKDHSVKICQRMKVSRKIWKKTSKLNTNLIFNLGKFQNILPDKNRRKMHIPNHFGSKFGQKRKFQENFEKKTFCQTDK